MAHELIAGSTKIRSQHITNHQHMISHHQLSKYCLQISYHHIVIYRSIQAKSRFTEHKASNVKANNATKGLRRTK